MTYEEFQLKVKEIAEKAGLTQYELYYSEQEDQSFLPQAHWDKTQQNANAMAMNLRILSTPYFK